MNNFQLNMKCCNNKILGSFAFISGNATGEILACALRCVILCSWDSGKYFHAFTPSLVLWDHKFPKYNTILFVYGYTIKSSLESYAGWEILKFNFLTLFNKSEKHPALGDPQAGV